MILMIVVIVIIIVVLLLYYYYCIVVFGIYVYISLCVEWIIESLSLGYYFERKGNT